MAEHGFRKAGVVGSTPTVGFVGRFRASPCNSTMIRKRLPWREELAIIDRTMKAISGVTDPEELVDVYWSGIGDLIAINDYVALSRRNVEPPFYLITRSSRFTEHFNPWTQREQLPKMRG